MLPAAAGSLGQRGVMWRLEMTPSLEGQQQAQGDVTCTTTGRGQAWWQRALAGQSDASQAVPQPGPGSGQSPRALCIPHRIPHRILHHIPHRIPHRILHHIPHCIPHHILRRSQGSGSW